MCRRKRSRPSSKRRLTKNVKRLSSGKSVCASAIGVVDEHRLRTKGPALATGASACLASAPVRAEEKLAVAVINFPREPKPSTDTVFEDCADSRDGRSASVRAYCAIVAAPPSWDRPFRPVALRPRLSTGLPLSLRGQCQSVADCSQALILWRGSQVRLIPTARQARRFMFTGATEVFRGPRSGPRPPDAARRSRRRADRRTSRPDPRGARG